MRGLLSALAVLMLVGAVIAVSRRRTTWQTMFVPVVGTAALAAFSFWLDNITDWRLSIFGLMILFVVYYLQDGIVGFVRSLWAHRKHASVKHVDHATSSGDPIIRAAKHGGEDLLVAKQVLMQFGGLKAINQVDLRIKRGTIHGLIGPNGSGKSTMMNVLTGIYVPTAGSIEFEGTSVVGRTSSDIALSGIARTFQNVQLFGEMTALQNVLVGLHHTFHSNFADVAFNSSRYVGEDTAANERAMGLLTFVGLAGEAQLNRLINGQLTSNLSGAQNYLHVFETGLRTRIAEFAKSGQLTHIAQEQAHNSHTDQLLATTIRGIGVDFLLLLGPDKKVIASCHPHQASGKVPASSVIEQAQIGVASSGFEQFTVQELAAFSPEMAERLQAQLKQTEASGATDESGGQRKVTVLMTAAHLPLSVTGLDAVLVGGVLIDENAALIEHLREIVYPTGQLPDRAEGFAGIFVGKHSIVNSRLLAVNNFTPVLDDSAVAVDRYAEGVREAIVVQKLGGKNYALAVSPIQSSQQSTIAWLAVGFPVEPFQKTAWILLAMLAGLLGLSMLAVSLMYLNAGRGIVQDVKKIAAVMRAFRQGNRSAQITRIQGEDELGALGKDVNALLRLVAEQEKEQIAAQQVISDEVMRRRTIFQNVRDGIAILDQNGQVFEVNDQLCAMLGYSEQELKPLQFKDWDSHFAHSDWLTQAGQAQLFDGHPVEQDLPLLGRHKTQQAVDHGGLARTRRPHQGDGLPGMDMQIQRLQRRRRGLGELHTERAELDLAAAVGQIGMAGVELGRGGQQHKRAARGHQGRGHRLHDVGEITHR